MSLSVIYLDDELPLLEMFKELFESESIQIEIYSDYLKCLSAIQKKTPDVLIVDYRLPGITGDKVAAQVPDLVTKAIMTGDLNPTLQLAFSRVFPKPYKVDEVASFLQEELLKRSSKI